MLKTAFDRLFAVAECDSNYTNPAKESVLLMAAEGDEFEGSLYWYNRLKTPQGVAAHLAEPHHHRMLSETRWQHESVYRLVVDIPVV